MATSKPTSDASEEINPRQLGLTLVASRIVRKKNLCCLSHPAYNTWLWQPLQAKYGQTMFSIFGYKKNAD